MPGKFEVYKDKAGEFRFRLKAANGQNILSSEGYSAKKSCLNGVESVKKNSQDPDRFVKKKTPSGKIRFNLTSTNGQRVLPSVRPAQALTIRRELQRGAADDIRTLKLAIVVEPRLLTTPYLIPAV
jgi:uncharacterized protein YegP (UPF0339 family)